MCETMYETTLSDDDIGVEQQSDKVLGPHKRTQAQSTGICNLAASYSELTGRMGAGPKLST